MSPSHADCGGTVSLVRRGIWHFVTFTARDILGYVSELQFGPQAKELVQDAMAKAKVEFRSEVGECQQLETCEYPMRHYITGICS